MPAIGPIHLQARGRLTLLLAVPAAIGLGMLLVARQASRGSDLVRHTLLVELSLERLLSNLKQAETGQRGYLLTDEAEFLDQYRQAVDGAPRELAALRALTEDSPMQQAVIAEMAPTVERRLAQLERVLDLHRSGEMSFAALRPEMDRGTALMNTVRSLGEQMRQEEERLLQARELSFANETKLFASALIAGYGLTIIVVGSLYRESLRYSRQTAEAEARLSRANAELDQLVRERTATLAAREQLLFTFVKRVPAAVAMLDREMRYLQVSDRWCANFSIQSTQILGRSHFEVFPDVPQRWKNILGHALSGEILQADEDRWDRADGTTIWLRWEVRPWDGNEGPPKGIIIFSEDITRRKQAETALRQSEEELRALARRLLTAQDDERRRIARDLHDEVTQQLAFLSIEIGKAAASLHSAPEARRHCEHLQEQVRQISSEIRQISHGLHPSVIEDFGLGTALEELCREFGAHYGIRVLFDGPGEEVRLSTETSTSFYRMLQEGLHNAVKHAHATEIRVSLALAPNVVRLSIKDNGVGFSSAEDQRTSGLGIVNMKERMRMVNGTFSITSVPAQGTEILATVPV